MSDPVVLDGRSLTPEAFLAVVRAGAPVALGPAPLERMRSSRRAVEKAVAEGRAVYGVTTGFGALSAVPVPRDGVRELQTSLVRSHACGTGPPLPPDVVRGLVLCRVNSLARGLSGIRPEVVELLVAFLNRGLVPWVPEQGSVGASGDLAPLAHLALAAMGEGAFAEGRPPVPAPAGPVLERAGLAPVELEAKEGVALLNGTALMASYLALGVADARALLDAAVVAAAMAVDALLGTPEGFDDRLGEARNAPEERRIAAALRALLDGSELAVRRTDWSGQDPYTVRCLPQVLGAVGGALRFAGDAAARELNAVTDNPLVLGPDEFVSGGNFHGQSLAFALDALALAVQYVAGFSERRTSRLLHPALSRGLPAFLAPKPGVSSGLMVPQYVAASLVNESATLVHPASATSLPTSADQEDFVSMGGWAGAKLRRVADNARKVVAIEWIVAGQALELRRPRRGGRGSEAALRALRARVAPWTEDRSLTPDLERVAEAIASGELVREVRQAVPF
jgi:histidine ammonia-lyase